MNQPIKVLFVEDNEDDVVIAEESLKREGLLIECKAIVKINEIADAIKNFNPDVIVSDYNLVGFTALDVLNICKDLDINIPFVVLTGSINEEVAVKCLKAGADDYVLKKHIKALPHTIKDIIEKKKLESEKLIYLQQLQISELKYKELARKFRHFLSSSPSITYSLDVRENKFIPVWVSENIKWITGYDPSETLSPDWWFNNVHPEDREETLKFLDVLFKKGEFNHEYRFRAKDGSYLWIHDESRAIKNESGDIVEIIGTWADITEKKLLEEELNKEKELLISIMNISPAGILVLDKDGKVIYANQTFSKNTGYEQKEVVGKTFSELNFRLFDTSGNPLQYSEISVIKALTRKEEVKFSEVCLEKTDGSRVVLSVNASPILDKEGNIAGAISISLDITKHKKLESQFQQAQKLEAIGRLTGGIAHDFNNLLSAIVGFSELILMKCKGEETIAGYVKTILDASDKAKGLIQQLMLFSQSKPQKFEPLNLNNVVLDFQKMLTRIIGEDIILTIINDEKVKPIIADHTQIEQIILNLAVNARDAMPKGGKLIIETKLIDIPEAVAEGYIDLKQGEYVMLSVTDTGCGMTDEVKSRLFEPFFTTKEVGKGTGLGLATVYGIVKSHNAAIHVYSEVGIGTTFKIYFPVAKEETTTELKKQAKPIFLSGTETILLVEDNDILKNFLEVALRGQGYTVISYDNPNKALDFIKTTTQKIDLVITDIVMPNMSGKELEEKFKEAGKDIKFLFMSGYTDESLVARGILEGSKNFISKPFKIEDLLSKIRQILG